MRFIGLNFFINLLLCLHIFSVFTRITPTLRTEFKFVSWELD